MLKFQRCCLGVIIALQGQIELEIILMVLQVSSENVKAGCNRISFFLLVFYRLQNYTVPLAFGTQS
jgi:hypothetical protein